MSIEATLRRLPAAAVVLLALLPAARPAQAELLLNPAGWRFPNIITSAKEAIQVSDRTPTIPGKETVTKGYRKSNGTFFMTYEIEGKIFGVDIDEDGKPPFEYSIMDSDGDGKFETKIPRSKGNRDRAYVPQWVIDYYFRVHPDVTPGASGHAAPPSLRSSAPDPATPAAKTPPKRVQVPLPPRDRPNP
jgi:hypothetical protein